MIFSAPVKPGQEVFRLGLEVPVSDLEEPYNHLHHARSLILLERARVELLDSLGFSMGSLFQRQLFPVLTRVDVRYLREIRSGLVEVTCDAPSIKDDVIIVEQRLFNERRKLAVWAEVEWVFMDGISKRAVAPPGDFSARYAALVK